MKTKDVPLYHKHLMDWYSANCRALPWRSTDDPYKIWISEVMLQQTQVNTVLPYYQKFLKRFPDVKRLAGADLQEVLKVWEGLGYYARARNLHRAAGIVHNEYNGMIPDNWEALRKLPGVGDYIAAALLSIAYNQPYPVVDGNVKRVLARLECIDAPVNHSTSLKTFQQAADLLKDSRMPGTYNQAVMELGAVICKPKNPLCEACSLNCLCRAYKSDAVAAYPRKITRRKTPQYHIAVGVVMNNGRVLITRRKSEGLLGGLWEFPGGKMKKGETGKSACIREIREEVNLKIKVVEHLARVKHAYTHFKIVMEVFCCEYEAGRVKLNGPVDHRWIKLDAIDQFPLPKANHKFLPKLKAWFDTNS
jgi:A/G-specific adenine glycosylase